MFPLSDDVPAERVPLVTWTLIALNLVSGAASLVLQDSTIDSLCLVPARLLGASGADAVVELATLLTSMFLHADLFHLLGNMWFLYLFGDNVEDRMGHVTYTWFYLAAGLAGSALHIATNPDSPIPTLGASGAISGVLGAYVVWYASARVNTLIFMGFFSRTIQIQAVWFIGFWFAQNLFGFALGGGGTAWGAHIGGFVVGLIVAFGHKSEHAGPRPPRNRRHLRDATWE